jgi:uncharacterized protein YbaR (Trm112 family)
MHIELIDLLRCPEQHEETWLVAAFNKLDGREIIEAKLGCPVCKSEYAIRNGIADFGREITPHDSSEDALATAAFLDLTSPGKTVLLAGAFGRVSQDVVEMTQARVISLNASSPTRNDRVLEIQTGSRIPLASNSLDGVALDRSHSTDFFVAEAGRLLRPGGRLLVSAEAASTSDFNELARDKNHIIAERTSAFISISKRS